MKHALSIFAYAVTAISLGLLAGYRTGQEHPPEPPVCVAICTPYTEAARQAEDAAERCDKALLTCLSWQVVVQSEFSEMTTAFWSFRNAITGCEQQ